MKKENEHTCNNAISSSKNIFGKDCYNIHLRRLDHMERI